MSPRDACGGPLGTPTVRYGERAVPVPATVGDTLKYQGIPDGRAGIGARCGWTIPDGPGRGRVR
jgi:hypothetical protein